MPSACLLRRLGTLDPVLAVQLILVGLLDQVVQVDLVVRVAQPVLVALVVLRGLLRLAVRADLVVLLVQAAQLVQAGLVVQVGRK